MLSTAVTPEFRAALNEAALERGMTLQTFCLNALVAYADELLVPVPKPDRRATVLPLSNRQRKCER
jgi:uncharacterized protein (DUF1778 family)